MLNEMQSKQEGQHSHPHSVFQTTALGLYQFWKQMLKSISQLQMFALLHLQERSDMSQVTHPAKLSAG